MNNLLKINKDIQLTNARLVVDLRNRIIHTYDTIDETIVWKVIIKDLTLLQEEVELLLRRD